MATDVEIERSLNALSATLNDQRLDRFDVGRLQQIVTSALGGQPHLQVAQDTAEAAWLEDRDGRRVGRVERRGASSWHVERHAFPTGGGTHAPEAED